MGKKAMDIVLGMTDFERLGEKRASAPDRLYVMGAGPAYDCARELMSWLEKAARIDHEFQDLQSKRKQVQKILPESSGQQPGGTGATYVSDPGMPRRPATAPLVDVAEALKGSTKDHPEKTAFVPELVADELISRAVDKGMRHTGLWGIANKKKQPEKTAKDKEDEGGGGISLSPEKMLSSFTKPEQTPSAFDPTHEAKIRSIRTKLVVNDMIANDPVLSAYPPEHVFNAYNEVSRIAPGLGNEPLVIRSLIGRAMQTGGRLDQNEIKQLLEAEQTHRQIRVKGF
jgi:hypothetical protein